MTTTTASAEARLGYSIDDVIEITSLGRSSVYEEIRLGRLRSRKLGRRTLILHDDLADWLASLPVREVEAA